MHWTYRHSAAIAIMGLCAAMVVSLSFYGPKARVIGPSKPVAAALPAAVQLSHPADAFGYWQGKKFHGRIVVDLTGRWQPVQIEREQLDRVRYPLTLKNLAREQAKNLTDDNFLFGASVAGIARRIITIFPEEGYLRRREISAGNKTFTERDGTFTLYHEGFARDFTTLGALRAPQEPVLLYIEDTFAPGVPLAELVRQLGATGLMVDSVVFAHTLPALQPTSAPSR